MSKAACFLLAAGFACAQTTSLTISTGMSTHSIDRRIYGLAIDSSVWGEEIRNRSFEDPATEGQWKVNAGVLEGAAANSEARFHLGDDSWRDCDLSLDFSRGDDAAVTIALRASANRNIAFTLGGPTGFEFSRTTPTRQRVLQPEPGRVESDRYHHLRIRAEKERVQVWLDDRALQFSDPIPFSGHMILGVRGGTARFARISINSLEGTPLFEGVPSPARHWSLVGNAEAALDSEIAVSGRQSIRITARAPDAGIEQQNLSVRTGDSLRGSLSIAGAGPGMVVRLLDGTRVLAEQTLAPASTKLTEVPLLLTPRASSDHATLRILARARGAITIDHVTLMADSARSNSGLRPTAVQGATRLHPPILRWDAGNWKAGIGPQAQRAEPFGVDEFVAFARAVGADPVIAAPAAPSAVELIEYCNGGPNTTWGAARTRNGHAQPYNLRYLELAAADPQVLQQTATSLKAAAPALRIIAPAADPVIPVPSNLLDFIAVRDGDGESAWTALAAQVPRSRNQQVKLAMSEWSPLRPTDAARKLNAMERTPAIAMATMQWRPGSPADTVLKLYSETGAPDVLQLTGTPPDLDAIATRTVDGDRIVVKLVNPTTSDIATDLVLRGDFPLLNASLKVLAAGAEQPVDGKLERKGMTAHVTVPAGSVALVTLSR